LLNFKAKDYIIKEGVFTNDDFFENLLPVADVIDTILIPNLINIKSFQTNPPRDSIIKRENIHAHIDFEFNYEQIKKVVIDNQITFENENFKISIKKETFSSQKENQKENFIGVNYKLPLEIISSIKVSDTGRLINFENLIYKDLAEPNFDSAKVYKIDEDNFILEMHNSDGAGAYAVYFFINKTGLVKRYIVYV
jgi:hypothetical protein